MKKTIWQKIKLPILALAPMANVTDSAFRQMFVKYGKPSIFFTEFISADGLAHPIARKKLLIELKFALRERPIIAQFFGGNPENIYKAARLAKRLGFDGVDINMGCPDKNVERQGGGASLIKRPKLAGEIIEAAKKGAPGLGISVKTRIGYDKNQIEEWIGFLLEQNLDLLTVHLRTRKEMSLVAAHWEEMPKILKLREKLSPNTLILGNGDVKNVIEAEEKIKEYMIDGVMIGRGVFGNPWFFNKNANNIPIEKKLKALLEHAMLFDKLFKNKKNFLNLRKHFGAYIAGYNNVKQLRMNLMETHNLKDVKEIVASFLKHKL